MSQAADGSDESSSKQAECLPCKLVWRPDAAEAVAIPPSSVLKEGSMLGEGVKLGKFLGAGVQARVFDLVKADGSPTGRVIKIAHEDLGHRMLNSPVLWINAEREWETGTQLRMALQEPDGHLPGFMAVQECLVTPVGAAGNKARFCGMVLERLNGWEVYKRVRAPEFHNIHYVREMLRQVFTSLERAQRLLGFEHADLGMRNIMEHYPKLWQEAYDEAVEQGEDENQPHLAEGAAAAAAAAAAGKPLTKEFVAGSCAERCRPGYSCNLDGSRVPLGPEVEFKIIDYGLAVFDPVLAQAAGGEASKPVAGRLRSLFKANRAYALSCGAEGSIQMMTADTGKRCGFLPKRKSKEWRLLRTPCQDKYVVMFTGSQEETHVSVDRPLSAKDQRKAAKKAARVGRRHKRSAIEVMYRRFWRRKGDVFHILLNIAHALDGRVWPAEDEAAVQAFISLVYHVTGVKMQASFAEVGDKRSRKSLFLLGLQTRRDTFSMDNYGRNNKWFSAWRRAYMMIKAHWKPFNPGTLAAEALTAPFFGRTVPTPEASQSVPLHQLFPASAKPGARTSMSGTADTLTSSETVTDSGPASRG